MLSALTHEGIRSAFGVDTDALAIRPALVLSEEFRDVLNDCHLHWSSMHPAADDAFSTRYMVCQTELVTPLWLLAAHCSWFEAANAARHKRRSSGDQSRPQRLLDAG
jgi:hypothetical protein